MFFFAGLLYGFVHPAALADVMPAKVSDIVVRPRNIQQITAACTPNLEMGFIGLVPPPDQVFMMTGIYWSTSSQPGDLIEINIFVTDGDPNNFKYVAPLSTVIGPGGQFAGIQEFPVPVPLFRDTFTHLCLERQNQQGILGTGGFWIFGFFAPDK